MIIYNVTVKLDREIHEEWLEWMRTEHILDVLNTGFFESHKLLKLLEEEEDGVTYAVQYYCKTIGDYKQYEAQYAPALKAEADKKFKDRFVAFRTLLEVVE